MFKLFKAELSKVLSSMHRDHVLEPVPDLERHKFLHPSGFPTCSLRTFNKLATEGLYDSRWTTYQSDYYCSVGTSVHTVLQRFLGRVMEVVGNWKCLKCGDVKLFTTFEKAGLCCRHKRHYEELGIKFRSIRGHTDGLFIFKNEYIIADYKTSSVEKVTKYNEDKEGLPLVSNVHQIRAYVVLVEKEYSIKIKGWVLAYAARDNPFKNHAIIFEETTEEQRSETKKRMVVYDRMHNAMLDIDKSGVGIDFLIENKPCKCEADYQELFANPFDECPIHDVCFDKAKLRKKIDKLVTTSKYIPIRLLQPQTEPPPKPVNNWRPSGTYTQPKIEEF